MSQLTKKAIVEVTMQLAEQKPLNKITVRDIVEACGITRNTFYYYFHDIYEVLEEAIDSGFTKLRETWDDDYEKALFSLLDFCLEYKKLWSSLYRSVGYEGIASYIKKQLRTSLMERLEQEADGYHVSKEDMHVICVFYEEALVGIMMRWIKDDKAAHNEEEMRKMILRAQKIFAGAMELNLKNSSGETVEK
ncbi:MAG: TetR/AcrR family transcriptional regulator C-terminal domain-containing protein [Clostridia bacterium]|nr:TetR/AcrR family transcriptional regulator C-terminal domain-containing protein [Clostridia bacterium]